VLPLIPAADAVELRDSVSAIARRFGPGYFQRVARERCSATELWQALGAAGFLGIHLPREHDGGGLGLHALAAVVEETARAGCPALAALYSPGVIGTILERHATPEQKQLWLSGLATGRSMASFAITEPDAGTNSHRISTTARRDNGKYILSGQKYYTSGMEDADFVVVVARTSRDQVSGRGRLSLFVVDADSPGLVRSEIATAMNMPERQWELFFDDVEVAADRRVGPEDDGLRVAFTGLNTERVLTGAICTGVGMYALDRVIAELGGGPANQAAAHALAQARIELEGARLMTEKAALLYDAGADAGEAANMAKLLGADAGAHALDCAIQTYGAAGLSLGTRLANYWFIVRTLKIGPVSREMILNFVAERTLGLPRSY
jgi:alkylation response protein AidB-like acyl-CoA dehydrogenase